MASLRVPRSTWLLFGNVKKLDVSFLKASNFIAWAVAVEISGPVDVFQEHLFSSNLVV